MEDILDLVFGRAFGEKEMYAECCKSCPHDENCTEPCEIWYKMYGDIYHGPVCVQSNRELR